jgi:hypothetical protein
LTTKRKQAAEHKVTNVPALRLEDPLLLIAQDRIGRQAGKQDKTSKQTYWLFQQMEFVAVDPQALSTTGFAAKATSGLHRLCCP